MRRERDHSASQTSTRRPQPRHQITPADAAIALQLTATGGWDPAADVNNDNHITSLDALMILQAAAGAITL
jgi:hypothetical protein